MTRAASSVDGAATNQERVSRRQVDKFAQRRDELARAALQTLAELGYARTSLREIAQNSPFSHGVLHYYFSDKVDLITHCVKHYKALCVQRYDEILSDARTAPELLRGLRPGTGRDRRGRRALHRLWYDMRSQSMFEPAFRLDVLEIDDSLQQHDLADRVALRRTGRPAADRRRTRWPTPCSTGCSSRRCSVISQDPRGARSAGRTGAAVAAQAGRATLTGPVRGHTGAEFISRSGDDTRLPATEGLIARGRLLGNADRCQTVSRR